MTHFIGVDGEGVTHPDGRHDYVLLSVGDQSLHDDGKRLTFNSILSFLYRQHQLNPRSAFVGFYLSYDFSQWIRSLPEDKAFMLLSNEGVALRKRKVGPNPDPFPIRYNGWEFDMLGSRRFKLRPHTSKPYAIDNVYSWMWICDSGPFWQTSFLNAINPKNWGDSPVCTDEEYAIILEGKNARTDAGFDESMIRYNVTENIVLARAMSALDSGFRTQNWRLQRKQWFGPGQAADLWMRAIGAPTREQIEETTPREVLNNARCAYYGGWFEIPRHGFIPGTSYEYDINSAYPYIISRLPCLLHGYWTRGVPVSESNQYQLVYVRTSGTDQYIGGLPHRDAKGIITRPHNTEGWYWAHEVYAAIRAGLITEFDVSDSWLFTPSTDCECRYPFKSITRLYDQRLSIGKNTAAGKALKLVYNSSYGKTAQSVGNPRFANAIYASLITAGCRTMILDAIATHPNGTSDLLMVATDGVYFRTPHPGLPLSPTELGAWDESTKENMTLFMPGVYWDDKSRKALGTDSVVLKSRGINAKALSEHIHRVDEMFRKLTPDTLDKWPEVTVPIKFSVITPKLALARNKWETCGNVVIHTQMDPHTKTLSSDPINKRINTPFLDDRLLTTRPYDDLGPSIGYARGFGSDLEGFIGNAELITDDGSLNMELIEMLRDDA